MLTDAYQAEREIQLQGALLQRHGSQRDTEEYRVLIRQDRLYEDDLEPSVGIKDILHYAASRVIARFLNENYSRLNQIRQHLAKNLKTSLKELRQDFEEQVLFDESKTALEWISQTLGWQITCSELTKEWEKVRLRKERHAETVIYGHLAEIFFNTLKYADHQAKPFLKIDFIKQPHQPADLLGVRFENTLSREDRSNLGTGNGLESIAEDLRLLNETHEPSASLKRVKGETSFVVTVFYREDLILLEEKPHFEMPTIEKSI